MKRLKDIATDQNGQLHNILSKEPVHRAGIIALVLALFACMGVGSKMAVNALTAAVEPEGKAEETVITSASSPSGENHGGLTINSTFGDKELPIYSVETDEKKVALSFDAAWGAEDFMDIMKILEKHNTKVTFFMTGGWVADNPDCVRYLAEHGHDLGNHSEHHYDMTTISADEVNKEILAVHDKVKELTGQEMFLFRPPYGAYDNRLVRSLYDLHYYPIQWSVDSLDWKNYGADSIIRTVTDHKALGPGAIILCHNGAKYITKALDTVLNNLEEKGYQVVPVSELILRDHYHMDVTGRQIPDDKNGR